MLGLAVAIAEPFVWAGVASVVAAVTWVLTTAGKAGIGDIVERKLQPVHDRLDKQAEALESIEDGLKDMDRRKDQEHLRIWTAIDRLRDR